MSTEHNSTQQEERTPLFTLLRLVLSHWKFLLILYFTVGVITVIFLLFLPYHYRSTASVAVLQESGTPNISSAMADMAQLGGLSGITQATPVERYMGYLSTKRVVDQVIEEFDLMEAYEQEYRELARETVRGNMSTHNPQDGTFSISFVYKEDPVKAKEIVEFLYERVYELSLEVQRVEARNYRQYLEEYHDELQQQLREDENHLMEIQRETGILSLQEQIRISFETLAEMEAERMLAEIELDYVEGVLAQGSAEIMQKQQRLEAIKNKIDDYKSSQEYSNLDISSLPRDGRDFARALRDVEVGTEVFEFIRLQYEQALLDENKQSANLHLVDPPQIPDVKYKPKRLQWLVVIMFLTLVLSLIGLRAKLFYEEHYEQLNTYLDR